ncbi:MAG: hypothetical protein ACRECX_00755 [Methyloceanibacter sp.]|uniref:hypothetical protein n=1 Tax=Methyloceanibacter sp. TaxID=1965321 RepID=UPI003D6CD827
MPSVDVVWKGNCRDPQSRYRLLAHLHRLAALSDDYLRRQQPDRPAILTLVSEDRASGFPARANIEVIDREISGKILVSSWIGPNPETLIARAREAGLTVIEPEGEGPPLIALDRARLRGLDFKLYDPRGLYPGADRMSFVFLECPEHHFLDGRLVEIAPGDEEWTAEQLRRQNVYLCTPSVHLRYYLEDWTDCLFSWIRFFFMGDFWWRRWEELEGYTDYRGLFGELQAERGSEAAEEATFEAILGTFSQHAEHLTGQVEGWAKAEKA